MSGARGQQKIESEKGGIWPKFIGTSSSGLILANFGVLHRARQAFSSAENVGTGLFGSGLPRITVSVQLRHLQAARSQGPKPDFHRKSKTSPSSDLSVSWPSPPRAIVSHLQGPNRPEKSQIGRFVPRCTKSTFWGFFVSGSIRPQN